MKKVKYIRVSSEDQNEARQKINSNEFDKVYVDKCSGSIKLCERKEGKRLLTEVESGQISEVHIQSLDRLGRNIIDILTVIEYLSSNSVCLFVENIGMYSLIEGKVSPSFKMIVSVLANVAEMERSAILERQRQGIELAKAKGIYKGRLYGTKMKPEEILEKYKKVVKELKGGQSLRRSAALGGCSLGTAQKVKHYLTTTLENTNIKSN